MKPIRLTAHAKSYFSRRGFSIEEVEEAIRTSSWEPAELHRLQCRCEFAFNSVWNDKLYRTKQVRPVLVEEENEIVVITVYTFYY
jgi:hypothetical protein